MPRVVAALTVLTVLVAAACGGSSDSPDAHAGMAMEVGTVETSSSSGSDLPQWTRAALADPGPEVALVFATSDYAPGSNRIGFLLVRGDGSLVESPEATIQIGSEDAATPERATAVLRPVGPEGSGPEQEGDPTHFYVTNVDLPKSGRYWLVAEPEGDEIQGVGAVDVQPEPTAPAVGSQAIASDNPTLDDAPAGEISTANPPDTGLLRYSIADSLEQGVPFVVVFATPQYCQSRACGPTVEVVDRVREDLASSGIRFIHVEIYQDNDPSKGVNQWVQEWHLPTEPWVFLVGADGVIHARFEGPVAVDELEQAVKDTLL
jgi:hypothetical protein